MKQTRLPKPPRKKRLETESRGRNTEPTDANVEVGPKTQGRPKFDAVPDAVDIRDWFYQPRLTPLPDILINCDSVPEILDQGTEGACTGFALAAVVNYLLHQRNIPRRASERMLYEMARRYDEWPGEEYEGSSARGAMKGWAAHGVCDRDLWVKDEHGVERFDDALARDAMRTPGGAYYRVTHRQVRDMHAALHEVGILYVTLMVHDGWFAPGGEPQRYTYVENGNLHQDRPFPIIRRKGRAKSGHAVALIGYTPHGFIVQNSWGRSWGADGFALLPYEDYLMHATDVWAAQLGVPVFADLWKNSKNVDTTSGLQRAMPTVPLVEIRPYVIDIGNDGRLSGSGKYWTNEADLERLFSKTIPEKTAGWSRKRVMLYLHGGLNDEEAVARRVIAFRDVCLNNQIYPIHIMWETGWKQTLDNIIADRLGAQDERAGGFFDKLRGGLGEARDWSFEHTVSLPGTALWDEMKENAEAASTQAKGGVQLLLQYVDAALKNLSAEKRKEWELHIVGHSAGSIFAAHAIKPLLNTGVTFKTLQLMAPAITVELFKRTILPLIGNGVPHPTLYLLDDDAEKTDAVWIYGKSLLYLVSNAFERERGKAILGMERFVREIAGEGNQPDPEVAKLFTKDVDGRPSLVVAGRAGNSAGSSTSSTHGGFDNDAPTLNSVLRRILDLKPNARLPQPFDQKRDLSYG